MGDPIIITVDAQTGLATVKLDKFLSDAVAKLNAANASGAASAAAAAAKSAGSVGKAAAETGAHIAGLTFYARSAADGIRAAFAGGGARAGFYAIDEAVRGLIASGLGLSTLVPVLGVLAAAVGGGVLVWREWTSAEREAAKATKDLHDTLKGTADLITQMQQMAKAGLMSPEALQRNLDILTGKIKLFKDASGNVSESATSVQDTDGIVPGKPRSFQAQNTPLVGPELIKYVQDQLAVPGGLDQEETKSKDKLLDLRAEVHAQTISDTEAEIQKIHEKYEAERNEIEATSRTLGKLLTPDQEQQNKKAIAESIANESVEINAKRQEQIDKINEDAARGREEFARSVNERLDADLVASAAKQGKTREQIYQEEFQKRTELLAVLKELGILNEQQYTDAVKEAQTKRLEGEKRNTDEIKALRNKLALAGAADLKRQELEINQRYDAEIEQVKKLNLSLAEQLKLIQQINSARNADLDKAKKDAADEAALNEHKYQSLTMMVEQMLGQKQNLTEKEKLAEDRIDAEREQSVRSMFTNMGLVAKSFGEEGVAVYKGIAIAQATIDTAKAAIGAYSSVVGIPYIGPFLAPVAAAAAVAAGAVQIAEIESASAREHGGPVSAGLPYLVGERGPELIVPQSDARVFSNADTSRLMDFARSSYSSKASPTQSPRNIQIHFWDDDRKMTRHIQNSPEAQHAIMDVVRRNAHFINHQSA